MRIRRAGTMNTPVTTQGRRPRLTCPPTATSNGWQGRVATQSDELPDTRRSPPRRLDVWRSRQTARSPGLQSVLPRMGSRPNAIRAANGPRHQSLTHLAGGVADRQGGENPQALASGVRSDAASAPEFTSQTTASVRRVS
jgi:hypothetical protein